MAVATSKRAAAMSVPSAKERSMYPAPFDDVELMPVFPETVERAPSMREVTCCSTRRAEASGHENETLIVRCGVEGVYCTLSRGRRAAPITASAAMMSSTEKAGMPRRRVGMFPRGFIVSGGRFHNRPAG